MCEIKEVLRLHYEKGLSIGEIGKNFNMGRSTVQEYLDRAQQAGLNWPLPLELDETSLEHLFFPSPRSISQENGRYLSLDIFIRN